MSYRLQCPKCGWVSYGIEVHADARYVCSAPKCSFVGSAIDFSPKWIASEDGFRAKTSANILARLLGSQHTRVDGQPFNSDVHLPELAEVAVNAADALIVALSRPPNEALFKDDQSQPVTTKDFEK